MCARRLKYPFIMDYMRPSELSVDEFHSFCKPQHLFNPHACGLSLRLWLCRREPGAGRAARGSAADGRRPSILILTMKVSCIKSHALKTMALRGQFYACISLWPR